MSIADAKVTWKFNLPIAQLPQRRLFQGADIARDPVTGIDYLFQGQAHPTGPLDVEDWSVHRYRMDGPDNPVYVDSMRITGAGHIQAHFARISAASNPYIMCGFEMYDSTGKVTHKEVRRCLYRPGVFAKDHANFKRVFTGPDKYVDAIGNDVDFTVVLRRSKGDVEHFEWYMEKELLAHTSSKVLPPIRKILKIPKHSTVAQSWTSAGSRDASLVRAFRFNGYHSWDWSIIFQGRPGGTTGTIVEHCNVTSYRPEGVEPEDYAEPEMIFMYQGKLYFGKQCNSSKGKVLAFFSMSW